MKRKKGVMAMFFVVLMLITSMAFVMLKSQNWALVSAEKDYDFCVVIDPGHGGFDGGAVAKDGTVEKDINLKIGMELQEILKEYPVEIIMTRNTDESLSEDGETIRNKKQHDMQKRKTLIEQANADLTISIHLNSYPSDASVYGAQVFYPAGEQKRTNKMTYEQLSKTYAENVQKSLEINIEDGRERTAMAKGDTYLLKNVNSPFILVECGFLSNIDECNKLKTADYQRLLAKSIWEGINSSLGLKREQKIQIIQSANKQ